MVMTLKERPESSWAASGLADRIVREVRARRRLPRPDGSKETAKIQGNGIRYLYTTPHSATLLLAQHDGYATWSCDMWTVFTSDETTAHLALQVAMMDTPDCHVDLNRVDYVRKIMAAHAGSMPPSSSEMMLYICQAQPGVQDPPPPIVGFLKLVESA